jgi:glycine/D-amino acid oxidase-like deaminating enzyme
MRDVPGFVAYYANRNGDEVATVTVCDNQTGIQESSRRAAEWVRQNLTGGSLGSPEITEGEAFIQFNR